jgi:protein-disulfide isomerase-like protein with CxxC motif
LLSLTSVTKTAPNGQTGVTSELLGGLDGDEPARRYIMQQDREIAEKSGRPVWKL